MIFKHPDHLQFLIDKITDEDVSSINIITSKNVLPLIEKIEALNIKTINIFPSVNQDLIEPSDIFLVFDDIELLDSDIGIINSSNLRYDGILGDGSVLSNLDDFYSIDNTTIEFTNGKTFKININDLQLCSGDPSNPGVRCSNLDFVNLETSNLLT